MSKICSSANSISLSPLSFLIPIPEENELAGGKETPTKIESEENMQIRTLDDGRKKLRNKEYKSTIENIEYAKQKKKRLCRKEGGQEHTVRQKYT